MSLHDELKSQAKLVAKDVRAEKASAYSRRARDFMDINPDAVLGVIDLIHREANRKKPNDAMIQAFGYMFSTGMEALRYKVERQHEWAEDLVDEVRELLFLLAKGGVISPHLLMFLLNGFIEAKLDPGEDLTDLLGEVALEQAADTPIPDSGDLDELLESIVEQVGGNEFEVYAALAQTSQAMPPEVRQAMMGQIAASENPVLRDTGVLYLLDPAPEVRRTVCQTIARHGSPSILSPTSLRRMIALRNWLPEGERHYLDAAIKMARQKQVECASWPQGKVGELLASNMDGAGAQSIFAVVKEGRKHVIASLLVKQGVGVADAWCIRDQSKADVKDFLGHIRAETTSIPVDLDFLHTLVPHYLAVGRKAGNVPTPGFLDFVEAIGIEKWQPSEFSADDLLSLLEKDATPSHIEGKAAAEVIERSNGWCDESDFLKSWFEDDAEVEAVLSEKPRSRTPAKVNAIIKSILEPRRGKWVERFLWTALWLKQKQDLLSPWMEFLVVGRELHRGRPIKEIPVMRNIAEVTVMAATAIRF